MFGVLFLLKGNVASRRGWMPEVTAGRPGRSSGDIFTAAGGVLLVSVVLPSRMLLNLVTL